MNSVDVSELYKQVNQLLEIKSKNDPSTEPYKSKYAARDILEIMKSIISNALDNNFSNEQNNIVNECILLEAQLSAIYVHLGILGLETEELSTGQEHLEKVLAILKEKELSTNCVNIVILCLNNLAILWSQRDEQEKAQEYLAKAKNLYFQYKNQDEAHPPKTIKELFNCDDLKESGWVTLEKFYTLTLYYLAQVLGKLGNSDESANLLLTTIHRQLISGEYQPLTWAINAANLSKYYINNHKYRLARRILAASWTMIQSNEVESRGEMEETDQWEEKLAESKAHISRTWGFYCLSLLEKSSEIVEDDVEDLLDASMEEQTLNQMEFCRLEISSVEESVTYKKALDYEDAKKLFKVGLNWLNDASHFYTLEDHASTHTEVAQEMSKLYKYLAEFDLAPDRRSKMHKRRIDLLTPLAEELNVQYYLQVCRQLDYELGETYSAMVDCKYSVVGSDLPSVHQISKINILVHSGIKHFTKFLDSFIPTSGERIEKYPSETERPVLVAFFHLGRLWSKLKANGPREELDFGEKSLENYKNLVTYCDKYPETADLMSLELPACREMVQLLPYKLERIRERIS